MIQSVTAYTYEIDDVELAISEIKSQIEKAITPDENMLGIVLCSYDFVETGVIKALSEEMPFCIIGGTTVSQAVHGESGLLFLTLMVMYGDGCFFSAEMTDALPEDGILTEFVSKAYSSASDRLNCKDKLILAFPPLQMFKYSGDSYVRALSEASGNVPVFGSSVTDDSPDFNLAYTIFNGNAYKNRLVFALLGGALSPKFIISTLPDESKYLQRAEITASKGNVLMGVNDMPVVDYLESIGLAKDGKIREGIFSLRFMLDMEKLPDYDGVPVSRAIISMLPDKTASCGGEMPVGSTFTIGFCKKEEVLGTIEEVVKKINNEEDAHTAIIFSCMGRRFALGGEPLTELKVTNEILKSSINYVMAYSGGELCPTSVSGGKAVNRFHNYTLVACIL